MAHNSPHKHGKGFPFDTLFIIIHQTGFCPFCLSHVKLAQTRRELSPCQAVSTWSICVFSNVGELCVFYMCVWHLKCPFVDTFCMSVAQMSEHSCPASKQGLFRSKVKGRTGPGDWQQHIVQPSGSPFIWCQTYFHIYQVRPLLTHTSFQSWCHVQLPKELTDSFRTTTRGPLLGLSRWLTAEWHQWECRWEPAVLSPFAENPWVTASKRPERAAVNLKVISSALVPPLPPVGSFVFSHSFQTSFFSSVRVYFSLLLKPSVLLLAFSFLCLSALGAAFCRSVTKQLTAAPFSLSLTKSPLNGPSLCPSEYAKGRVVECLEWDFLILHFSFESFSPNICDVRKEKSR